VKAWLGLPLAAASRLRRVAYDRGILRAERLKGPVVSVGNLAVGGRGKTPVVVRVCELLREEGLPLAVLSRGYKGSFRGHCLVVSDGERIIASAAEAGDEPVMLARQLPGLVVAVGKSRARVGRSVEERFGPRVHVLDDGFQHLRLHRDLDLVCVHVRDLEDVPLPAGRLREPVSALARADLVVLGGAGEEPEESVAAAEIRLGRDRVLRLRRKVLGFAARDGAPIPPPRRPFLLAAIGHPERFVADATASCGQVVGTAFFRDHHVFSPAELRVVSDRARRAGADAILTTAKDEIRLAPRLDLDLPVAVLRVAAQIDPESVLVRRLRAAVERTA
jgi:tetraacyldisaccharide 4'-kinase